MLRGRGGLVSSALSAPVVTGSEPGASVLQHVAQCAVEGDLGLPARRRSQLGVRSVEDGELDRPEAGGVGGGRDLDRGLGDQARQHVDHGGGRPGTDVVDLARLAGLDQEPIGPHHVADVGQVAAGAEIAVGHLAPSGQLGLGDLRGESGRGERGSLARSEMIEGPGNDHVQVKGPLILHGDGFGRLLAGSVGRPGRAGRDSSIGWSSSETVPYTSELLTSSTRATLASTAASSTETCRGR